MKSNLLQASPHSSPRSPHSSHRSTSTSFSLPSLPRPRLSLNSDCCGWAVQARTGAAGDAPFPHRSPLPGKRMRNGGSGPRASVSVSACPLVLRASAWLGSAAPPPEMAQTSPAPRPPPPLSPPFAALGSGPPSRQNRPRGGARRMGRSRGGAGAGLNWAPAWGCRTWEGSGPAGSRSHGCLLR